MGVIENQIKIDHWFYWRLQDRRYPYVGHCPAPTANYDSMVRL